MQILSSEMSSHVKVRISKSFSCIRLLPPLERASMSFRISLLFNEVNLRSKVKFTSEIPCKVSKHKRVKI